MNPKNLVIISILTFHLIKAELEDDYYDDYKGGEKLDEFDDDEQISLEKQTNQNQTNGEPSSDRLRQEIRILKSNHKNDVVFVKTNSSTNVVKISRRRKIKRLFEPSINDLENKIKILMPTNVNLSVNHAADLDDYKNWLKIQEKASKLERFKKLQQELNEELGRKVKRLKIKQQKDTINIPAYQENKGLTANERLDQIIEEIEKEEMRLAMRDDL